jgi:glycerol-3-phosphate cytidylyltransferase
MKTVITYGTFDYFHQGHKRLLERARKYGDRLIVGVTSEHFDMARGKLNVEQSLEERIKNVERSGLADEIIVEDYFGQKEQDIIKYKVDFFIIGSDWIGEFDYLNQYCTVKYIERTKNVSSTLIRSKNSILNIGIVGNTDVTNKFLLESRFISGINVFSAFSPTTMVDNEKKLNLEYYDSYSDFLSSCDIVYIATYHSTHFDYIKTALENKKHVLCESPVVIKSAQLKELFTIAEENKVILLDALKTAYAPGFIKLLEVAKSGVIGAIKDIDVCYTSMMQGFNHSSEQGEHWGSIAELSPYTLLPIIKLLGTPRKTDYYAFIEHDIDLYTKINFCFSNAFATSKNGVGVKSEGSLCISGTHGYIYVPAPWWKTQEFEVRFEDSNKNKNYFYTFADDGLRYEISEMLQLIRRNKYHSPKLTQEDSILIYELLEAYYDAINKGKVNIL